jgi:hypothetical protein
MRRFGTLASLEMLDDTEQAAEDSTDSEDGSDIDEGDCNKKQEVAGPFYLNVAELTFNVLNIGKVN